MHDRVAYAPIKPPPAMRAVTMPWNSARREAARRAPTVAVELNREAEPVSEELGRNGIACWAGDFYAVRPLTAMGVDLEQGVLRMSSVHYTSAEDVTRLIAALDKVL